ncbi:hypothetical protein Zmor_003115 [Zophobas morio]|uniref:Uncharacterized protein n=1 Tax=Zophobas morio TaxID=2755281 RepID=A0AA38HM39_9CUCU|nr:hypothetical protein Zmor_003115 [Zophobas morio]
MNIQNGKSSLSPVFPSGLQQQFQQFSFEVNSFGLQCTFLGVLVDKLYVRTGINCELPSLSITEKTGQEANIKDVGLNCCFILRHAAISILENEHNFNDRGLLCEETLIASGGIITFYADGREKRFRAPSSRFSYSHNKLV